MNRNYELVVILDPEMKAEEQEKLLAKIKKFIIDAEGEISTSKEWGKKELVFPIAKRGEGVFHLINLTASTTFIPSLRQKLTLEEKILRFLLVVEEPASAPPRGGATAR